MPPLRGEIVQSIFLTVLLPTVPDRGAVISRDKTLIATTAIASRSLLGGPICGLARHLPPRHARALLEDVARWLAHATSRTPRSPPPPTLGVDVVCYRVWSSEGQLWELAVRAAPPPHPPHPPHHRFGATRTARHHASDPFEEVGAGRGWMELAGHHGTIRTSSSSRLPLELFSDACAHRGVRMIGPVYFAERSGRSIVGSPRGNLPLPPPRARARSSASFARCSRPIAQLRPAS